MRSAHWFEQARYAALTVSVGLTVLLTSCAVSTRYTTPVEPEAVPMEKAFSFLHAEGTRTLDEEGRRVALKGCNLGNWLLLEMWMMEVKDARDDYEFESILEKRFGVEGKDRLMEVFRENWITERDFEMVRSFGFNVVRLPFDYTLLEDDARPFVLKKDAFKWLDAALEWAEKNGLYVILDMHGVPGRQSTDHCCGRADYNRFWSDKSFRDRTVWLWKEIAQRYKDRPAVAAYEPINEPFGDYKTENHLPMLIDVMDELYKTIRSVDPRHLIVIPGVRQGITFYGPPHARGWENVLFTEHYYAGVHHGDASLETHRWQINRQMAWLNDYLEETRMPFLLGEFNVVFGKAGGPLMMRHYYDLFEERGWWGTLWTYKLVQNYAGVGKDNWYMVKNAEPRAPVSIRSASYEEIEAWFRWFGSMDYAVYENLRTALTAADYEHLELEETPPPTRTPFADAIPGWQAGDVAATPAGGQRVFFGSRMDVYGGGRDIWNDHDEFHFVWQPVDGDFTLEATVTNLDAVNPFTKAGIMIRKGLEPGAPHVLLNVFPDSRSVMAWRSEAGGSTAEKKFPVLQFPIRLKLQRAGKTITASYATGGRPWATGHAMTFDWMDAGCLAGLAVGSHDNRFLACGSFENIKIQKKEP